MKSSRFVKRLRDSNRNPDLQIMYRIAERFPLLVGASWYFLEKFIRLIGAFLIGAWVARHLGPEHYGSLAYVLALVAVLGFLGSLGIESLVVRDLVEGERSPRRILSTYFFIRLAGALTVPVLSAAYLVISHDDDRVLLLLAAICSGAVVFAAFDAADCWLQAKNQARTTSVIRLVGFLLGALSKCLLVLIEASVEWFALVVLMESAVVAVLYYRLLKRYGLTPTLRDFSMDEVKHLVVAGRMMVLSGLTVAVYSKVDVLVVGALLSKQDVGSYAIAASMCAAWNMVGMSVAQAWAPRISEAHVQSQGAYIRAMRQLLVTVLALSLIGSLLLSLAAEIIFSLLLGPSYIKGAVILKSLIWSSVFVFLGIATSQIIVNERVYWISMLRTTIGLCFCLAIIYFKSATWSTVDFAHLMVLTSALATSAIIFSARARSTLKQILSAAGNNK